MKSKFDLILKNARLRYLVHEQNEQEAAAIAAQLGGQPAAGAPPPDAAAQSALPDAAMPEEPQEPEEPQQMESSDKALYKDAVDHLVEAVHDLIMKIKGDEVSVDTIRSQYIEINDGDFRAITNTDENNIAVIVQNIDQLANKMQAPFQRDAINL
jgi:hypothetical protein